MGKLSVRRTSYEISSDILRVARGGALKSHLVYKANLNFEVIQRYLGHLIKGGLIENSGRIFRTTEKGVEFIIRFQRFKDYVNL